MSPDDADLILSVPAASRRSVAAEVARVPLQAERVSLSTLHLDTPDHRLSQAGLSWRLRRQGRHWVQTLEATDDRGAAGPVHQVVQAHATPDVAAHADTPQGRRLAGVLERAADEGVALAVPLKTQLRRTTRRVRARGAVVDVAYDDGRLIAGDDVLAVCELRFSKVSGSAQALLALAERWRRRHGLTLQPWTQQQRGQALVLGRKHPPVCKARRPDYPGSADVRLALGAVVDECLAQITGNAVGLTDGDPLQRAEHVHQLRIGIRRLRSALRSFRGWAPMPPPQLVDGLKALFAELGRTRDADVLAGGVAVALARAGAPPLEVPPPAPGLVAGQALRAPDAQRLLLAWISWRQVLAEPAPQAPAMASDAPAAAVALGHAAGATPGDEGAAEDMAGTMESLGRLAERRLRRWHRRITGELQAFDTLEDAALHALRKRIKRQRYAVEFFAPVLRRRTVRQYLKPLAAVQDRMGQLNDLFVARERYRTLAETRPEAWFALGWIAARLDEVRAQARADLARLARAEPPSR